MVDPKEITVGSHYGWTRHGRESIVEVLDGPHELPLEVNSEATIPLTPQWAVWGFRVRLLDDELRSMFARADELTPLPSQRP